MRWMEHGSLTESGSRLWRMGFELLDTGLIPGADHSSSVSARARSVVMQTPVPFHQPISDEPAVFIHADCAS